MVPLTQGSERSLGLWQTYRAVFAASIKMQLCMDVMHGRQRGGGLLLSTLHSGHAGLPCGKAVISPLEAQNPVLIPFCAAATACGGAFRTSGVWRTDQQVQGNSMSIFPSGGCPGLSSIAISQGSRKLREKEKKMRQSDLFCHRRTVYLT